MQIYRSALTQRREMVSEASLQFDFIGDLLKPWLFSHFINVAVHKMGMKLSLGCGNWMHTEEIFL